MLFDVEAVHMDDPGAGIDQADALLATPQRLGVDDQAEGLRRLLEGKKIQVITLVAGKSGAGRSSATLNLAEALSIAGRDVLVLDENPGPHNLTDRLGLFARHDLLDVVQGRCALHDALLRVKGYAILPISRLMRVLERLNPIEQQCLEKALVQVSDGIDVMLVDGAMLTARNSVSSSLATGVRLVVVTDATASGITESYSLIKRLALENAHTRFEILINKVANEQMARLVFGNMEKVAKNKLAVRLEYLGCIPLDDRFKRATQLARSVVEAYPAADSSRSFMTVSQALLQKTTRQDEMEGGLSGMMKNLIRQLQREGELAQCAS